MTSGRCSQRVTTTRYLKCLKQMGDWGYTTQNLHPPVCWKGGVCTELIIVKLRYRVLSLLDIPGMKVVIDASVDSVSAFSRTDPIETNTKFINMGLSSSIVNILIEFLSNRQMSVKWNGEGCSLFPMIRGGPQGSWSGQSCYVVASDDNADMVEEDDRYTYWDDLIILELVLLAT